MKPQKALSKQKIQKKHDRKEDEWCQTGVLGSHSRIWWGFFLFGLSFYILYFSHYSRLYQWSCATKPLWHYPASLMDLVSLTHSTQCNAPYLSTLCTDLRTLKKFHSDVTIAFMESGHKWLLTLMVMKCAWNKCMHHVAFYVGPYYLCWRGINVVSFQILTLL